MAEPKPQLSSPAKPRSGILPAKPAQQLQAMEVPDEAIAHRAYQKFLDRGCAHGFDKEDWAAASQELLTASAGQ